VNDDGTGVFVLPGFRVVAGELLDGEWHLQVETRREPTGCPTCGAVARVKDRRTVTVRDLPAGGVPVVVRWCKRVFECRYALCEKKTWTEQHDAIASRMVLTDRAQQWAFQQVGHHDRAVSRVAAQLGVSWHTIMTQVVDRGAPLVDDSDRLAGVTAVGVDETSFLRATGTRHTQYATGVADLTPGRAPRLLDVVPGRSGRVLGGLAGRPGRGVAGRDPDRVVGSVPGLRDRPDRPSTRGDEGSGPVPRREAHPAGSGPGAPSGPAGHHRPPRTRR
jgi:transposase